LKLHHADGYLEVLIDGESCFKTDKVRFDTRASTLLQ
jgi:mannose-binding lectin 1